MHFLISLLFAIAPALLYLPQWWQIKTTKTDSFSSFVCFILLISNILRICFWFGEHFDNAIVFQSMIMVLIQLLLLHAIVEVKNLRDRNHHHSNNINIFWNWELFWSWDELNHYFEWITYFSIISFSLTFIFLNNKSIIGFIGLLSAIIEATLSVPQLYQNYKRKETRGLSLIMVLGWLMGDFGKYFFYIASNDTPIQLIYGCYFQMMTDFIIMIQKLILYPSHASTEDNKEQFNIMEYIPFLSNNNNIIKKENKDKKKKLHIISSNNNSLYNNNNSKIVNLSPPPRNFNEKKKNNNSIKKKIINSPKNKI